MDYCTLLVGVSTSYAARRVGFISGTLFLTHWLPTIDNASRSSTAMGSGTPPGRCSNILGTVWLCKREKQTAKVHFPSHMSTRHEANTPREPMNGTKNTREKLYRSISWEGGHQKLTAWYGST